MVSIPKRIIAHTNTLVNSFLKIFLLFSSKAKGRFLASPLNDKQAAVIVLSFRATRGISFVLLLHARRDSSASPLNDKQAFTVIIFCHSERSEESQPLYHFSTLSFNKKTERVALLRLLHLLFFITARGCSPRAAFCCIARREVSSRGTPLRARRRLLSPP